ncbi:hypothetical protein [Hydrogenimonas sp.]
MGEELIRMIKERISPLVYQTKKELEYKNENERAAELEEFLQTLHEIIEDIQSGVMDEWECGELYEDFKKYEQSGTIIENLV